MDEESTGQILLEVFMCVLRPVGTRIVGSWRSAGRHPARLVLALVGTVAWTAVALVYSIAALIVPLTYGFLLTITAPVVVGALMQRRRASGPARRG